MWSSKHLPHSIGKTAAGLKQGVWGLPRWVWLIVLVALGLRFLALWLLDGPDLITASESGITAHNWVSGRGYAFTL